MLVLLGVEREVAREDKDERMTYFQAVGQEYHIQHLCYCIDPGENLEDIPQVYGHLHSTQVIHRDHLRLWRRGFG